MEGLWVVMTVVGPIVLIAAIIVVWARNRKPPQAEINQAEEGAKQVREEIRNDPSYRESPSDKL